jgi:hypothetical protein
MKNFRLRMGAALFALVISTSPAFAQDSIGRPRILMIGDSQSIGPFGMALYGRLKSDHPRTSLYASCGSIGRDWIQGSPTLCGYRSRSETGEALDSRIGRTPKLPRLLETLKPDLVIVALSGNYSKMSEEAAIQDMAVIARLIQRSGSKCLWVTAPRSRKERAFREGLAAWVEKAAGRECTVLDSWEFTTYPEKGGDGIHYWRPIDVEGWVKEADETARRMIAP